MSFLSHTMLRKGAGASGGGVSIVVSRLLSVTRVDDVTATLTFDRPIILLSVPTAGQFNVASTAPVGAVAASATTLTLTFEGEAIVVVDASWTLGSGGWVSPSAVAGAGVVI